jgi:DNA-directed RNA polymerase subunit RPC12/RpoP
MLDPDESFECATCGAVVTAGEARRTETMGGLDPATWQTLCCPECGSRLKTVFVGDE